MIHPMYRVHHGQVSSRRAVGWFGALLVALTVFLAGLPTAGATASSNAGEANPKTVGVGVDLQVVDEDTVTADQPVHWVSRSTVPDTPRTTTSAYVVTHQLDAALRLLGGIDDVEVALDCVGCPALTPADYRVSLEKMGGADAIAVTFTSIGRATLARARAAHEAAVVVIRFRTSVVGESHNGRFSITARVHPATSLVGVRTGVPQDSAATHFGPLRMVTHERGVPTHRIPDARFQVYLSAEDALHGRNPVTINGAHEWSTDEHGVMVLNGLRFSSIVNGLDRDAKDPLDRLYYVRLTQLPTGWRGAPQVHAASVHSTTTPVTVTEELWRPDASASPEPAAPTDMAEPATPVEPAGIDSAESEAAGVDSLPRTGAQILGALLLAAALLALGIVLARRRQGGDRG